MRTIFAILMSGATLLGGPAGRAQDGDMPTRPNFADRTHDRLSHEFESLVTRIDSLFAGKESHDAPTGSYLRLGGESTLRRNKDGGNDNRPFISAKIKLPNTQERLQLIVDQGVESITRSESRREVDRTQGVDNRDQDVFVGLRAIATETLKISLNADAGLRFRTLSPDPYVRARALRVFDWGDWEIPVSETFLYRHHDGFSAASEVRFVRDIAAHTALSLTTNATFVDQKDNWEMSQEAALVRRIGEHAMAALEVGAFADSRPNTHMSAYTLAVRYRSRVYKDWIVAEFRPQLSWPRERDYDLVPSVVLRIETYFGKGQLPLP